MKSLQARLTLWFALSFLAVTGVTASLIYLRLRVELLRIAFAKENPGPDWLVRGSRSEAEVGEIMGELLSAALPYSIPLVVVLGLLGYWLARKSLSPIDSLNRQLAVVGPSNLRQRVSLPEADEQFRNLTNHLNDMLARLEWAFSEMSEYAAKVSHELRTPLTILRLKVEQGEGRIEPELAEELETELHRLSHVVQQSLLMAMAQQGRIETTHTRLDLTRISEDLLEDFNLLAESEARNLRLFSASGCYIFGDVKYCRQILHALITNALIHGTGDVRFRISKSKTHVRVRITNRVRSTPAQNTLTLGLGLRVVKALLLLQPQSSFRQHMGRRRYGVQIAFPLAEEEIGAGTQSAERIGHRAFVESRDRVTT
jgi:signal transduction histidine kinase